MTTATSEPYELDGRALSAAIDESTKAEHGDDVTVGGYVTVALFDRPDGSSGLAITSTSASPTRVGDMLALARDLVTSQVTEPEG